MRIAQVSPLWERVPPPGYGGIELVVGYLTDELVHRGHKVTLFASGDSITEATLESVCPHAIRLDPTVKEPEAYDMLQLSWVVERSQEFDIIHFHTGFSALPFAAFAQTPVVHTVHNGFTVENRQLFQKYRQQPFISISNAQRQLEPQLNYAATVYNGIDPQRFAFWERPGEPPYLAFLGRMSAEKGPHSAIAIAKQVGLPLKMAGKVDHLNQEFFEQEIAPLIDGQQIQYLGELSQAEKVELLGNAVATLFPICWHEPFGLVMIESMCTGTPVIAMNCGSVPEVIADGQTGFVCNSLEEMVAAVSKVESLSRRACREYMVNHFSVARMVDGYEAVYRRLVNQRVASNGRLQASALVS